MSEEIAMAAADVAHVARLQEQLNYEQLLRKDTESALRMLGEGRDADFVEIRALLAGVRHYVMQHDSQIGECVAWNVLKQLVGIGQSKEADDQLWAEYKKREGTAYVGHYRRGTER